MKNAKIVLVAQWDGWCGACAAERPLVLTRTGRQRLVTWLTGAHDDSRPLVLTCRLCGTGVDVPLERDDPPVPHAVEPLTTGLPVTGVLPTEQAAVVAEADVPAVSATAPATPAASEADLRVARQAVAGALGALLAQRSAAASAPLAAPASPRLQKTPVVAPALPLQRTPSGGGLAELQLLADGIDLLSTGRA